MTQNTVAAEKSPVIPSDADVQFVLAEYDRLKGLEAAEWKNYYSRFNLFMTITLALAGSYITLASAGAVAISIVSPTPEILALIILVWGVFTFLGLVEDSYTIRHFVNALRCLQQYFTKRQTHLVQYLYFSEESHPELYRKPRWLPYLLSKYVLRGSPKLILSALNSGIAAVLVARLMLWRGILPSVCAAVGIVLFILLGVLHAAYVERIYRREYLV